MSALDRPPRGDSEDVPEVQIVVFRVRPWARLVWARVSANWRTHMLRAHAGRMARYGCLYSTVYGYGLASVLTNKALTERAAQLDADATRVRAKLAKVPKVQNANPLGFDAQHRHQSDRVINVRARVLVFASVHAVLTGCEFERSDQQAGVVLISQLTRRSGARDDTSRSRSIDFCHAAALVSLGSIASGLPYPGSASNRFIQA